MTSMHVPGILLVPMGIVGRPSKTVPITHPPMGSLFCQMGAHTHPCRALVLIPIRPSHSSLIIPVHWISQSRIVNIFLQSLQTCLLLASLPAARMRCVFDLVTSAVFSVVASEELHVLATTIVNSTSLTTHLIKSFAGFDVL